MIDTAETPKHWKDVHSLTQADRKPVSAMKAAVAPFKGQLRGIAARPFFDHAMEEVPLADLEYQEDVVGGVVGWWCLPKTPLPGRVLLYLHGGGYVLGSAKAFRGLAGQLALQCGLATFVPDYRLAPEHPFPAAPLDARAVYDGLLSKGYSWTALAGESAGGGLAMALLASLVDDAKSIDLLIPAGLVAFSPWTDLTLSGKSWETRAAEEHYFIREQLEEFASLYLNGARPADPVISPLFGDLGGLPPIEIHVGDSEVLLADSLRYAKRAAEAGSPVHVHVWEAMPHVFPSAFPRLEAARIALALSANFLKRLQGEPGNSANNPLSTAKA